jgi:hypothetical protein
MPDVDVWIEFRARCESDATRGSGKFSNIARSRVYKGRIIAGKVFGNQGASIT